MSHLIVFTSMPDADSANKLAQRLIQKSLAGCVNILPAMQSIYYWQGELERNSECQLIVKTLKQHYNAVEQCIRDQHPYELPEIIALPIARGLPEYMRWISDSCKTDS